MPDGYGDPARRHSFHLEINSIDDFERFCKLIIGGDSTAIHEAIKRLSAERAALQAAVDAQPKQ